MRDNDIGFTGRLLIFVSGLALIFLAHTGIEITSPTASRSFEAIGIGLVGYAPIEFLLSSRIRIAEKNNQKSIDQLFRSAVKVSTPGKDLPIFIAVDVEGCLTPPHRAEVNLRQFQRLRGYCEFVKTSAGQQYPPIVIYTGRSQGYVELLAQSLGMINPSLDLPFVIENGSALYFPSSRKTLPLATPEQRGALESTSHYLTETLSENEFEPKSYMISINPKPGRESIDELREKVILSLQGKNLLKELTVSSTASAVDVTIKNINKHIGLKEVLKIYHNLKPDRRDYDLKKVTALGDSTSDLCVIENVGEAFCPTHDVHPEVRAYVEDHFGIDNVIDKKHIHFVIEVVERTCGLKLL